MSDLQAIAHRIEIEALRGEFTDAAMMRDWARMASLFLPDCMLRMAIVPVELVGREEIQTGGERLHVASCVPLRLREHIPACAWRAGEW